MFFAKKTAIILSAVLVLMSGRGLNVSALDEKDITAPSAVLMDAGTGKILWEKNAHEVRACASITKVMTLTLVMEAIDSGRLSLTDTITASAHASSMGGSDIWLEPGESMTADDMIKATMVASANDAAVALAEHLCGSEDAFVEQMNHKAQELGMKETVFKNCNGLDEEGHVTSAYDVALMSRELLKHRDILKYSGIWMDELRNGKTQLVNTNKLLKTYKGITGLKTGTTSQAGSCITATAERDGVSLIAVVLGSASGKERFTDAAKLLDDGFSRFTMTTPEIPEEALRDINVTNGMSDRVSTAVKSSGAVLTEKANKSKVSAQVILPESLEAPVEKGSVIGRIIYKKGGEQIAEDLVTAAEDVKQISFGDVFGLLLRALAG